MAPGLPIRRRLISFAVAAAIALPASVAQAAPGTALERAESHLAASEFAPAGDAFAEYYATLPEGMRAGDTGEFVVMAGAEAYGQAFEADNDRAHLLASQSLLEGFVATVSAVDAASPLLARPRAELERLEALLAPEPDPEPEPEPDPEPEPEAGPDPEPDSATDPDPAPDPDPVTETKPGPVDTGRRDGTAIGLLAVGSVLLAGGVTLVIVGPVQHARYERQIDEAQALRDADDKLTNAELSAPRGQVDTLRNALIASGATLAALGVGGIVWGAVRLRRGRPSAAAARLTVQPRVGASTVGLTARGRF